MDEAELTAARNSSLRVWPSSTCPKSWPRRWRILHRILVADRSTQLHQIFRADDAHAAPFACATMTMPTRETARPKAIAQDNGSSNMIQAQIMVTGGLR
jgi:hypothetical protein